jgi:hypothetical protein
MEIQSLDIPGANGVPFRAVYLPTGATYGRGGCLTNEGPAMVEFYDMRYPQCALDVDVVAGQFVSRYYVGTLLDSHAAGSGLCLDGSNPTPWTVDGQAYTVVIAWLRVLASRDRDSMSYRERFPQRLL